MHIYFLSLAIDSLCSSPLRPRVCAMAALCVLTCTAAWAQGNYEIQVYGADTVEPVHTMLEFHSNFTVDGAKKTTDGTYPTNHQYHETLEITHGFNDWFETGFYIFTSVHNGQGWDYVGSHIRPRVRIPPKWHWPVGVSLSNEIGWQSRRYSADTWTWEIRPIVDKQLGPWYFSFNPSFERSFHGPGVNQGLVFSPNFKFSYNFTPLIAGGIEYYGSLGLVTGFDPISEQQQQIFPAIDLNVSPKWEINFGLGVGVTAATDHLIAKGIIGYRFDF
jgi:hypothetical protein